MGGLLVVGVCFVNLCHLPSERLFFHDGHLSIGVAAGSAVHLQENKLFWHVFHVREERMYRIIQILMEFLVMHPTLLIHSNPTGPLSNLVVTKVPMSIF